MTKVRGDIAVSVGADITPLKRSMRQASGSVRGFERDFDSTAERVSRMSAKIAVGIGAITAASATLATAAGYVFDHAKEIENLSRVAGVGVERFQSLAFAAKEYGIGQEKLSDILKDVNDKIGDFVATGAGPLVDFFDKIAPKVGVTVDQFRRLNSAEALALYVETLERANVSQAEMTFYLEAIASDATRLAPLLANNAAEMNRLETAARDLGVVIGEDLVSRTSRMHTIWNSLVDSMRAKFVSFASTVLVGLDNIFGLTDAGQLSNMREELSDLADDRNGLLDQLDSERGRAERSLFGGKDNTEIQRLREAIELTETEMNLINDGMLAIQDAAAEREKAKADLEAALSGEGSGTGDDPAEGGGGGAGRIKTEEDFERLRDSLATEREIIEEDYQERLAKLEEYRESEVAKEGEYAELKERLQAQHSRAMEKIARQEQKVRLNGYSSMFGDLATLMSSENKKLFAIGKAASLAQATIKGYESAVDAWSKGMKVGGPPAAAAFTAASLAKTGLLISNIASASPSGGGAPVGGGGLGGFGATQPAAPVQQAPRKPRQQVNLSIGDSPFVSRAAVLAFAEALQEASEDGARFTVR